MKPFTPSACPKCRTPRSGVRIRYCAQDRDLATRRTLCPPAPEDKLAPPVEHMHHTCTICGYEWVTATADALDGLASRRKANKPSKASPPLSS